MNPAEEIVKYWLQEKGYFVQSSIKSGRKEIDILAVNIFNSQDKKHIEVSVSMNMVDPENTPRTKALYYRDNNFEHPDIQNKVSERFGKNTQYEKVLVVGNIRLRNKDALSEFSQECKSLGIKVINFAAILDEISCILGTGTQLNSTIKTVQLCNRF